MAGSFNRRRSGVNRQRNRTVERRHRAAGDRFLRSSPTRSRSFSVVLVSRLPQRGGKEERTDDRATTIHLAAGGDRQRV